MIEWTKEVKKQFRKSIYMAFIFFIALPLELFYITELNLKLFLNAVDNQDLMFYILLVLAIFYPLTIPIIEKSIISGHIKRNDVKNKSKWAMKLQSYSNKRNSTPEKSYFNFFLVKSAFVGSSFIFGFFIYMVSGDMTRMLYFYAVGIVWSLVVFPTKSRCIKFLEKVSSHESV